MAEGGKEEEITSCYEQPLASLEPEHKIAS